VRVNLPTGKVGQLVAVVGGISFLAALWLSIIAPLLILRQEQQTSINVQFNLLRSMQGVTAAIPQLQQHADEVSRDLDALVGAAKGSTAPLAAAQLQQTLGDLAEQFDVRLERVEALAPQMNGPWETISIRVATTTTWNSLVRLLEAISTNSMTIMIDDLQLHAVAVASKGVDRPISVIFDATALRSRDGGPQ